MLCEYDRNHSVYFPMTISLTQINRRLLLWQFDNSSLMMIFAEALSAFFVNDSFLVFLRQDCYSTMRMTRLYSSPVLFDSDRWNIVYILTRDSKIDAIRLMINGRGLVHLRVATLHWLNQLNTYQENSNNRNFLHSTIYQSF